MAKNYGKNALNALNFSICDIEPLTKSQLLAFDSEKNAVIVDLTKSFYLMNHLYDIIS